MEKILIKERPFEERPREKIIKYGVSYLSNAELLAILLRTGNKNMSALQLADYIINSDKEGIYRFFNITFEELTEFNGIGMAKACEILSCIELGKRIFKGNIENKVKIKSPKDIFDYYSIDMSFLKKEVFKILLLNTKNEVVKDVDISVGSLNSSIVHPREVFLEAIKRSANCIMLVHNHPSGNVNPSEEDKRITNRLIEAGNIIGIRILDHIIIGNNKYYSFKENFLI
ncbi:MAG: DNA repair protein RadC [Peptostreptococcaceae bacterium]|jgi:DNA repair protein RadC|nr:DNA repair protein RadC [Peptostreptococcaceae bacterium]